jgi:hypothetical protein
MSYHLPSLPASAKGIGLATTFTVLGSLYTFSSATVPSIVQSLSDETLEAQSAAQQAKTALAALKKSALPAEILSILSYGYLSYHTYTHASSLSSTSGRWRIYAGAAVAMFAVIPLTITLMTPTESKLLALADAPAHTASAQPTLEHKSADERMTTSGGMLGVPAIERPAITPAEEFEPYEDSPFSTAEYEREKVKKMLKVWDGRNTLRRVCVAVSGVLGLWAMLG